MKIYSSAVHHGRNQDKGKYNDDHYVRCARCGFMCNTDRDTRAPKGSRAGWGITSTTQSNSQGWGNGGWGGMPWGGKDIIDPVVTGGCPQCGTFLYGD